MTGFAALVERLRFTYAGRTEPALDDVSFALAPGTWTLLAGRTGAGKSTLLRALAGLIPHQTSGEMLGTIHLWGRDTRQTTAAGLATAVGLVLQSPDDQICTMSVSAEVAFGLENLAMPVDEIRTRIDVALAQVGLSQCAAFRTAHLSGGQKQRLLLAAILAMRPKLLLLDEPLSQLDAQGAADLLANLKHLQRDGLTIVMVEHRLDELMPYVDRVLLLDDGRLVDDCPPSDTAALKRAFCGHGLELPEVTRLALELDCGAIHTAKELEHALDEGCSARRAGAAPAQPADDAPMNNDETDGRRSDSLTAAAGTPVLTATNLSYQFPGAQPPIWQALDFTLAKGECVALMGPNGSGKSTLFNVLSRLVRPRSGQIDWESNEGGRPNCGLVLQNCDLSLFCQSVREEIGFGPAQRGMPKAERESRIERLAQRLGLEAMLDDHPLSLSQGERLRTAVAAALAIRPRLLLLDEPTTGQDRRNIERVMTAVTSANGDRDPPDAVFFSTHDLGTVARFADRVLVLAGRRLLADCTPEELLADDELLQAAQLRRPPLLELRHRLNLTGRSVAELAEELRS